MGQNHRIISNPLYPIYFLRVTYQHETLNDIIDEKCEELCVGCATKKMAVVRDSHKLFLSLTGEFE
jgi:hypothetical protein